MKQNYFRRYLPILVVILLTLSLFCFGGCTTSSSQNQSEYYNAGNADLSITGAQLDQYYLVRFDTSTSALTLALPSAADIVANLSSPYVGEVINLAIAADGNYTVTLITPNGSTFVSPMFTIP